MTSDVKCSKNHKLHIDYWGKPCPICERNKIIKNMLDCYWDMSPLEYAKSRGLKYMTDEVGEKLKERARALCLQ